MATNLDKYKPKLYKISCLDGIIYCSHVVDGSSDELPGTIVPTWELIKIFKHFPLFFAKIVKIAYTRNGKDTLNIQVGITSFQYKISTQFLHVW